MYIGREHTYLRYTSFFGALFVFFMFFHSAVLDGNWKFGDATISHLGISDNALSAFLFNFGCVVAGVLFAIVGMLKIKLEKGLDSVSGLALIASSVFLALVGFISLNVNDPVHCQVATIFGILVVVAAVLMLVDDLRNRRWVFAAPMLVCVAIVLYFATRPFAELEVIAIAVGQFWMVLQAFRHRGIYECKPYHTFFATSDA